MLHFLILGSVLGLSAGLAPGPLLVMVITETLQHDIKSGVKVALAPIVTDVPIIAFAFFAVSMTGDFPYALGFISIAGGFFVLSMSVESIRIKGVNLDLDKQPPRSLVKGILANVLSPHPYVFWFGVGVPIMSKALNQNLASVLVFILGFYVFLVGSKIVLAVLVGRSKSFLTSKAYVLTMRVLGVVLGALALALIYSGLTFLGL